MKNTALLFLYLLATGFATSLMGQSTAETRFGFLGPSTPSENPLYYEGFTDLKVDFDRPHIGPFVWEQVEPTKGSYDWSSIDAWVEASQTNNVRIVATIWPYAGWDQEFWRNQSGWERAEGFEDQLIDSRYKPNDVDAYKAWVTAMVERYDGDGTDDMPDLTLPIKHWEILNEPESSDWEGVNFFKGTASDFFDVLNWTSESIRGADSEAVILHGGSSGVEDPYWDGLFADGATSTFDLSNTHTITPPDFVDDLRAAQWRDLIQKHDIQNFWITEVEMAKRGDAEAYTDEQVAIEIVTQYVKAFFNGASRIFYAHVYAIEDPNTPPDFLEAALATVDFSSGQPVVTRKPAYDAFGVMVDHIDRFTNVTMEGTGVYRFGFQSGSDVWAVWGTGADTGSLPESMIVTDLSGNSETITSAEFSPTEAPRFIRDASATTIAENRGELPEKFEVSAYPNPFNPATTLQVRLSQPGQLTVAIYDIMGRRVRLLAEQANYPAGTHTFRFQADGLSSGVYLYQIQNGVRIAHGSVTLVK